METRQGEINNLYFRNPEVFLSEAIIMKVDGLEEKYLEMDQKLTNLEQNLVFREEGERDGRFSLENERKEEGSSRGGNFCELEEWQELQKITVRAIEILSEWEETEDIRIQVQYAAILVGKINALKKKDVVRSHEVRKKVCTLVRNVIRLNIAEEVFSEEQIQLLKEGFSLITAQNIQKENLLQLNRKFRNSGLQTMPPWE